MIDFEELIAFSLDSLANGHLDEVVLPAEQLVLTRVI